MKTNFLYLLAIVVLTVSGCAGTTPSKNLALSQLSTIEGYVTKLDKGGFTLTNTCGSIYVRAKLPDNKKLNLSIEDEVTVYGNSQGDQGNIFDGYVIKKSSGEQITVRNPTP